MNQYHHIGGLDVTIHPIDDLIYKKINEFKNDKYFFDRALAHFLTDYKKYFKKNIKDCLQALFLIENKKDFYKLIELRENYNFGERNNIDINRLNNERMTKEKELDVLKQEYNQLKNKKYKLTDILSGKKKADQERINELHNMTTNTGIIRRICSEIKKINDESMEFYNEIDKYATIEAKIHEIKAKLRRSINAAFPNDLEFEKRYIDREYCSEDELEKLILKKKEYNKKLNEYRNNWRIAESYYNNFSKIYY